MPSKHQWFCEPFLTKKKWCIQLFIVLCSNQNWICVCCLSHLMLKIFYTLYLISVICIGEIPSTNMILGHPMDEFSSFNVLAWPVLVHIVDSWATGGHHRPAAAVALLHPGPVKQGGRGAIYPSPILKGVKAKPSPPKGLGFLMALSYF